MGVFCVLICGGKWNIFGKYFFTPSEYLETVGIHVYNMDFARAGLLITGMYRRIYFYFLNCLEDVGRVLGSSALRLYEA